MQLTLVDVFAESRYQGNQLAVVEQADRLDSRTMQAIAREMNFSETTFVTDQDAGSATVRIFTPAEELPFAGHPTLGTAWVLTRGKRPITLRLGAGDVPVRFEGGLAWLTPPAVAGGAAVTTDLVARLLNLEPQDLHPDFPPVRLRCGPDFLLAGVQNLDRLQSLRLSEDVAAVTGKREFKILKRFCIPRENSKI